MGTYNVRVAMGNGTLEIQREVQANSHEQAKQIAEASTGGKAKGIMQVTTKK